MAVGGVIKLILLGLGLYYLKTNPQKFSELVADLRQNPTKLFTYALLTFWLIYTILKHKGLLPKKNLKGKHVFITGGAMGLGEELAKLLSQQGCYITIVDVNIEKAQQVAEKINEIRKEEAAQAYKLDVTQHEQVYQVVEQCVKKFGDVDILINNAGIVSGKKILENDEKRIQATIAVNTTSHHYTVRAFLPSMLKRNEGHIVTIASMAGFIGVNGLVDYCASKFGAVGFDESLRMELKSKKSNVLTTCICPFYIKTGMFAGVQNRIEFMVPMLELDYSARRIINAIRQNEAVVLFPWIMNIVVALKNILPVSISDFLTFLIGANATMDHFVGRNAEQNKSK